MSRRSTRIAAVCSALLVVGALSATPAMADKPDLTSKSLPSSDQFCTVVAQPTPLGQDVAFTPAPVTTCFDSLGQALESVSGEPVTDPRVLAGDPTALREYAQEQNASAQSRATGDRTASAAMRMIGVSYKGKDYTSGNQVFYGNYSGGCEGVTFGFPKLSTYLQNNVISSMMTWGNCWSTLYDLQYYIKGESTNCVPHCTTLGSMDNRASSIVFRPQGTID
ncbi:hypothetical protein [Oerskovia turbata]